MNKYNGMKLARHWVGKRVITIHGFRNAMAELPIGSAGTITSQSVTGLTFKGDKCECCGLQLIVSHVNYHNVELEDPQEYTTLKRRKQYE